MLSSTCYRPLILYRDYIRQAGWTTLLLHFFFFVICPNFYEPARPALEPNQGHQNTRQQSDPRGEPSSDVENRTPYDILGIKTNADQKQIQQAYRKLANQYHPDKVSHLGEEFQKLAEKRFKEIQEAYDTLRIHK